LYKRWGIYCSINELANYLYEDKLKNDFRKQIVEMLHEIELSQDHVPGQVSIWIVLGEKTKHGPVI
jgi:hypothetical protein